MADLGRGISDRRARLRLSGRYTLSGGLGQGSNKPVAAPGESFYVSRPIGGVVKDSAQPRNGVSNAMFEIHESIGRPEFGPQLISRNDLVGHPDQHSQDLQRSAMHRQTNSGTPQFS